MNRQLVWMGGAFALLAMVLLLAAGCDDYGYSYSPAGLTALHTTLSPGPARETAEASALARYDTAIAVQRQADQTAQAAQDAAAQAAQAAHAAQAELEQQRLLATQQIVQATIDADSTSSAFDLQLTAWAFEIQLTATERDYQSTTAAQSRNETATAAAQATAGLATSTQQAREDRATATAESWQSIERVAHATSTRMAEEREEVLGYARDYGIPVVALLLVVGLIVALVVAARWLSQRPVVYPRSVLGDAEPLAVPQHGGGYAFVDLDRQPGPVIRLLADGRVEAPLLRSAGQEERTVARDQLLDAATRPRLGTRPAQIPTLPVAPPPMPPAPGLRSVHILRRLDQAERAGAIPPTLVAALEAGWEEETEA